MLTLLKNLWLPDHIGRPDTAARANRRGVRVAEPPAAKWSREFVRQYLEPNGWLRSRELGRCADRQGRPLPWYTYPAIRVLDRIAQKHCRVFEYGSGSSSLWWRDRSAMVVSVEHHRKWFDKTAVPAEPHLCKLISAESEENRAHYGQLEEFYEVHVRPELPREHECSWKTGGLDRPFHSYAAEILNYPIGFFDVIVVDGRARVLCAWLASRQVAAEGVIVFDNSDRTIYAKGCDLLTDAGFGRIDFWGPGPLNAYEWCTSIFTRDLSVFR